MPDFVKGKVQYIRTGGNLSVPMWYVKFPNFNDILTMLEIAGYPQRERYTFVITGSLWADSPKTGVSKRELEEDVQTRAVACYEPLVEEAVEVTMNMRGDETDFSNFLSAPNKMEWDDIESIGLIDKEYPGTNTHRLGREGW